MIELAGFISIVVLVVIQIILFAFGYGKLSQMVSNNKETIKALKDSAITNSTNIGKIERHLDKINGTTSSLDKRVDKLEKKFPNQAQDRG